MGHYLVLTALLLATFLLKGCHSQGCGSAPLNPIIVGGADASPGSWPWQAYLQIQAAGGGAYMCGGSLISKEWILTAAHCVYGHSASSMDVFVGLNKLDIKDPNLEARKVSRKEIHKSYNPNTAANDIALLKMSSPVTFNNYIQPVCLAQKGSTFYSGVKSWIAGWGTTSEGGSVSDILQEVSVPIVGDRECKCNNTIPIPAKTMCAGYGQGGKDTCQGDSGGPLVVKNNSVWVEAGIVSFGMGCARPNLPGVYTEVSKFQEWIENIVGKEDPPGFVKFTSPGEDTDQNFNCTNKSTVPPFPTTTAAGGAVTMTTTILCLCLVIVLKLW